MRVPRFLAGAMLTAAVTGAALLTAGCAGGPAQPGAFTAAPPGTVSVLMRRSSGSFGEVAGTVTWTWSDRTWEGRRVVALASPQVGTRIVEPGTLGLIAFVELNGRPLRTYEPALALRYPLQAGNLWSERHQVTLHAERRSETLEVRYKIEAYEPVTVMAGTFDAFRVTIQDSHGELTTLWAAPYLGLEALRRTVERPASHPAGAGRLEEELISLDRPR